MLRSGATNSLQRLTKHAALRLCAAILLVVAGFAVAIDSLAHANKPHELVNEHWVALSMLTATALCVWSLPQIKRAWRSRADQGWRFAQWLVFSLTSLCTVISGFFSIIAVSAWVS